MVSCVLEGVRVVVRSIRHRSSEQWTQVLQRTASSYFSVSGSLTRFTQLGKRASGHAESTRGSGAGVVSHR